MYNYLNCLIEESLTTLFNSILWRTWKEEDWRETDTAGNEESHRMQDLEPGETYYFRVVGCCEVGRTSKSDEVIITTCENCSRERLWFVYV